MGDWNESITRIDFASSNPQIEDQEVNHFAGLFSVTDDLQILLKQSQISLIFNFLAWERLHMDGPWIRFDDTSTLSWSVVTLGKMPLQGKNWKSGKVRGKVPRPVKTSNFNYRRLIQPRLFSMTTLLISHSKELMKIPKFMWIFVQTYYFITIRITAKTCHFLIKLDITHVTWVMSKKLNKIFFYEKLQFSGGGAKE